MGRPPKSPLFPYPALFRSAAAGAIEASDDGAGWRSLAPLVAAADDYRLAKPASARYVRGRMERPVAADGYILSEMEVFGRGGLVPRAQPAAAPRPGERQDLVRGSWRIQRDSLVTLGGEELSRPGADCRGWLPATVPGSVLVSYWNAGALPDPNYGDNQLQISDSFFYSDFWYRDEFAIAAPPPGRRVWLNFDGTSRSGARMSSRTTSITLAARKGESCFSRSGITTWSPANTMY